MDQANADTAASKEKVLPQSFIAGGYDALAFGRSAGREMWKPVGLDDPLYPLACAAYFQHVLAIDVNAQLGRQGDASERLAKRLDETVGNLQRKLRGERWMRYQDVFLWSSYAGVAGPLQRNPVEYPYPSTPSSRAGTITQQLAELGRLVEGLTVHRSQASRLLESARAIQQRFDEANGKTDQRQ